jgi:hypothetical protein
LERISAGDGLSEPPARNTSLNTFMCGEQWLMARSGRLCDFLWQLQSLLAERGRRQRETSRRNDIQVFSLLGSQATGPANAEYDLTVVSLANKEARATKLPNQDTCKLYPESSCMGKKR